MNETDSRRRKAMESSEESESSKESESSEERESSEESEVTMMETEERELSSFTRSCLVPYVATCLIL